jgi:large subunit ribosomal protein L10|tara:strand:- start:177 stop:695 length:519 start_codon:yes stop_codon:yes gene_type:complete
MPNTKNINQVEQLTDKLSKAKAVYFTEYHGLNVEDITKLRREFSKVDVEFKVAKNTLIKLAADNNKLKGLDPYLSGSTAIAISYEDPTGPARVLKAFKKEHELPDIKGIIFEGEVLDGKEFKRIADLPTKDQLLAMLASSLSSPMTQLALTLKSSMTDLGNVLSNLKDQKSN